LEPANASVNFNLGLLLGELGKLDEAERCLRTALKTDPRMAAAAYNLGVIVGRTNPSEGMSWCRVAYQLRSDERKYAETLAYFQRQTGDRPGAIATLSRWVAEHPSDVPASLSLGQLHEDVGDRLSAERVYRRALGRPGLPAEAQRALNAAIKKV